MVDPNRLDTMGRRVGQRGSRKGDRYQPAYVPDERDREFVQKHGFHLGEERTAQRLGISKSTLRRHYRKELKQAEEDMLLPFSMKSTQLALQGDGSMLRFLLANRFPDMYSIRRKVDVSGNVNVTSREVDWEAFRESLKDKSEEEIAAIIDGIDALIASGGFDVAGDADDGEGDIGGSEDSGEHEA